MSSYLTKQRPNENSLLRPAPPKRISLAASDRLSDVVNRSSPSSSEFPAGVNDDAAGSSSDANSPSPPPLTPKSPKRSKGPPPTTASPVRSSASTNRGRNGFRGSRLGEAPQEEDEKPPPYTPDQQASTFNPAPPGVSAPSSPRTPHRTATNESARSGHAFGTTFIPGNSILPKPTLEQHPAMRKKGLLTPGAEKIRNRGGWWRVILILLALFIILALALGLGLGLTIGRRKHSTPPQNTTAIGFPVGNWNFDVVQQTVDTGCTSNPATYTCFPYTTYAQSPAQSRFVFNWVINSTNTDTAQLNDSLTLSSTANTFALNFGPTPLTLQDAGSQDERYTFSLPLAKQVQPAASLTADNARTVCYFNSTMLSGVLYTRSGGMRGSDEWPGTAFVSQSSPSGQGTPDCYKATDGSHVDVAGAGGGCACDWVSQNATMRL